MLKLNRTIFIHPEQVTRYIAYHGKAIALRGATGSKTPQKNLRKVENNISKICKVSGIVLGWLFLIRLTLLPSDTFIKSTTPHEPHPYAICHANRGRSVCFCFVAGNNSRQIAQKVEYGPYTRR